jgi:cold shock CspA family protein
MSSNDNGFYGGLFGGGRSNSPTNNGSRSGFNDMKIGTWNEGSSGSGNGMSGSGGNGSHMNGPGGGNGGNNFTPMGNFEIGTFNISSGGNNSGGNTQSGNRYNGHNNHGENHPPGPGHRETGIIEKLLHSYGFIQCCDRQARLFFHFSQFDGNIEHLKIGDPVEFEMTYDRRTGKPIASAVTKIAPEVVMREERVIGFVTTEARTDPETGGETQGRISYENRGECFFLPFTTNDVEGNVTVASGDKVSFQMATMARSGNLVARTIRLENPAAPVKYQGVVNSIQEDKSFGFIERADVVREIFFRNTDLEAGEDIDLGDNVEFTIQTRNGKEVATNIIKLPSGTVVFEDVGTEYFRGQVLKPIDRNYRAMAEGDALSGRVKYRGHDRSEKEVQFGETDQVGDFTLKHGDWVKFVIAVDRRDKHPRATKIELLDESFKVIS